MTEDKPIRIPITDVLDLHMFAPRDAKAALKAYLEEAQLLGFEALRIVHGRGTGVQRDMVRPGSWPAELRCGVWRCAPGGRWMGINHGNDG